MRIPQTLISVLFTILFISDISQVTDKWNYYDLIRFRYARKSKPTHSRLYIRIIPKRKTSDKRYWVFGARTAKRKYSHPRNNFFVASPFFPFFMIPKHIIQIFIVLRGSNILFPFLPSPFPRFPRELFFGVLLFCV